MGRTTIQIRDQRVRDPLLHEATFKICATNRLLSRLTMTFGTLDELASRTCGRAVGPEESSKLTRQGSSKRKSRHDSISDCRFQSNSAASAGSRGARRRGGIRSCRPSAPPTARWVQVGRRGTPGRTASGAEAAAGWRAAARRRPERPRDLGREPDRRPPGRREATETPSAERTGWSRPRAFPRES